MAGGHTFTGYCLFVTFVFIVDALKHTNITFCFNIYKPFYEISLSLNGTQNDSIILSCY